MKSLRIRLRFVEFPPTHTCEGPDTSPELEIVDLDAVSIAIMAINPFEPCCSFASWLIWNIEPVPVIPAAIPRTPLVSSPVHAVQGINDYGGIGYRGPCPPPGETHRITFRVYGLDVMLDLEPGATKHQLIAAMRGHVLQYGETMAMYRR
jgi:Raf kinase inhibitor-like YbhB/YbcL family protein